MAGHFWVLIGRWILRAWHAIKIRELKDGAWRQRRDRETEICVFVVCVSTCVALRCVRVISVLKTEHNGRGFIFKPNKIFTSDTLNKKQKTNTKPVCLVISATFIAHSHSRCTKPKYSHFLRTYTQILFLLLCAVVLVGGFRVLDVSSNSIPNPTWPWLSLLVHSIPWEVVCAKKVWFLLLTYFLYFWV